MDASTEKKKPAKGGKLPVVAGDAPKAAAGPAPAARGDGPAKAGGKAAKVKAGGWAAFTDSGTTPRWIIAARVVMVIALAATVPTLLAVEHGNRILWTMAIASLPFFWVVAGYHVWRRICPLAVAGQLGRLVGRPGTRKVDGWLADNYLFLQLGLMLVGLSLRLTATNGNAVWLSGFLITVVVAAAVVSLIYGGKTWCNFICPVGLVEKVYTEPSRNAAGAGDLNSQCSPCVACKKHCPDIDLEQGYWKELPDRGRFVYFAWPGIVVAFYVYYWLYAGSWEYYFSGGWAYDPAQPSTWLDDGFHFLGGIPRVVAAPLTLIVFGAASAALFYAVERVLVRRRRAATAPAPGQAQPDAAEARLHVRHQMLAIAGFTAFNAFYFFAGQPSLRRLPSWVVTGWGVIVVFASAAIFFRRFRRREAEYVQEKFAQKILKKWEWGDAPPSDELKDIYLLHTERTKQREARLRAYKETVRELVADGLVSRAELVILDSLRAQLGISDKDHQKVLGELTAEEKQLFDPAYQGSVEQRLKGQQYRKELERVVVEAARTGAAVSPAAVATLRGEYSVGDDEHAAEMARILGEHGPIVGFVREEIAAIERLGGAAAAAHVTEEPGSAEGGLAGGHESATVGFVAHLARWRGTQHAGRALGLLGAISDRPEIAAARDALAARPRAAVELVDALRGTAPDELVRALLAALERLWAETPAPFTSAPFLTLTGDASRYLRAAVAIVLSRFDDEPSRAALVAAMDDPDVIVRQAAVRALGSRSRLTRELLQKALTDKEPRVRSTAVRAVSRTTSGEFPAADAGVTAMAQTVKGVGNAGVFATLDANARVETLTEIEKLVLLRQVPMFAELAPDHLEDLAEVVVERHFQPGHDLCREGEAGDAVFLLVKGKVKVMTGGGADGRPERVLNELGPGAVIGEMAVFDAAPRSATVRAVERTRSLTLPGDDFKTLLLQRPEMSQVIIGELVRRMRGLMVAAAK